MVLSVVAGSMAVVVRKKMREGDSNGDGEGIKRGSVLNEGEGEWEGEARLDATTGDAARLVVVVVITIFTTTITTNFKNHRRQ